MNKLEVLLGTELIVNMNIYDTDDEKLEAVKKGNTELNLAKTDIFEYIIKGLIDYFVDNREYWSTLIKEDSTTRFLSFSSCSMYGSSGECLILDSEELLKKCMFESIKVIIPTIVREYIKAIDYQNYTEEYNKIYL